MLSVHKLKCSWSLAASIISVVGLISVVHLFLFPVVPSFDYLTVREAQNSCSPVNGSSEEIKPRIDLDNQFPANSHDAVVYRGAQWKASIGRWLSGSDAVAEEITVTEVIGGLSCKNECSGQGVCNRELGQCRCFHGFSGEGCSERQQLECNYPVAPDLPYGRWVVSICPAHCHTTRAMCFCGEGTKYPNRPLAESCGFKLNFPTEPGAPVLTDWGTADVDVFTTNASKPGWCNVDPDEAYSGKAHLKEECDCKYDGLLGRFCEIPVSSTCINQCSGRGYCRGGSCQDNVHRMWRRAC